MRTWLRSTRGAGHAPCHYCTMQPRAKGSKFCSERCAGLYAEWQASTAPVQAARPGEPGPAPRS